MTLKKEKYLILGCGPAGLIAAHTLRELGIPRYEIEILSQGKIPSAIGGAQYLHDTIVGDKPDFYVHTVKLGSAQEYADKVYGDSEMLTSFETATTVQPAWSLRDEYSKLWHDYVSKISTDIVTPENIGEFTDSYKHVFSSVPAHALCRHDDIHEFPSMKYALVKPRNSRGEIPILDNIVIYNGRPEDRWYRYSCIQGHPWIEFERDALPSELRESAVMGDKPLGTDCDCVETAGATSIGRLGTWDRKVLLHHVVGQVHYAL